MFLCGFRCKCLCILFAIVLIFLMRKSENQNLLKEEFKCGYDYTPKKFGWNSPHLDLFGVRSKIYAPEKLKKGCRVFKYPHYYGFGCGFGRCYGEPYYIRTPHN